MQSTKAILIAGPTASGKSALALTLAERFGGAIINADSMQVYRELRILTARPGPEDEARVAHMLYGFISAGEGYSVGRYVIDAERAIGEARAAGRRPIIVGGTGLYFKALLEGLSPIPPIPAEIRSRWRERAQTMAAQGLHAELIQRDPRMAERLRPTDTQRLVRALEVIDATGRSLGEWQQIAGQPLLREADTIRVRVAIAREEIHRRCDTRFDHMLQMGALDEAARLRDLGLSPELPVMSALGLRPLLAHLAGRTSLDEAAALAKAETRQYVKRQATWFNRNMMSWMMLGEQQMERNDVSEVLFG